MFEIDRFNIEIRQAADQAKPRWWRIDWMFTTPEVKVHNYHLIMPNGLSDHKAQQFVISTR